MNLVHIFRRQLYKQYLNRCIFMPYTFYRNFSAHLNWLKHALFQTAVTSKRLHQFAYDCMKYCWNDVSFTLSESWRIYFTLKGAISPMRACVSHCDYCNSSFVSATCIVHCRCLFCCCACYKSILYNLFMFGTCQCSVMGRHLLDVWCSFVVQYIIHVDIVMRRQLDLYCVNISINYRYGYY